MDVKRSVAGTAQGFYALALSWFALSARLSSEFSWLLWAYVGFLALGAFWTFGKHRHAWRFSMLLLCAPVVLALLWIIGNGEAFVMKNPFYADSPASIFVALILGLVALIPPLLIALLLFAWRKDLDARN